MKLDSPLALILTVAIAAGLVGCARGGSGASPETMIAAAKALDQQFTTAFNKGDLDGVMATYDHGPDVVLFAPDELEVRGWDSIRKGLQQALANAPGAHLELVSPQYRAAGDVVIGWGTFRLINAVPAKGTVETMGRYTDVKAQRDGKWVYIVDHASVPLPPPSPTADDGAAPEELDQQDDLDQPEELEQPDEPDQPDDSERQGDEE